MIDDKNIINGCIKGKHKFQMALFDKYAPLLRTVCLRYSKNENDADDLLQEGFIKILSSIKNYQEKGAFVSWMKKIMINQAINFYNKTQKNKHKTFEDNLDYDISDDDEKESSQKIENRILEANLTAEQIIDLICELPDGYKMVLNLYVFDEFSHKEIAETLSISVNTSKSQLSRARRLLIEKTEILIKKTHLQYEQ